MIDQLIGCDFAMIKLEISCTPALELLLALQRLVANPVVALAQQPG